MEVSLNERNERNNMTKKDNNTKPKKQRSFNGLFGALELFVVLSIAYMAFVVITGLDDVVSKVLTAPAVAWAVFKLVQRFVK